MAALVLSKGSDRAVHLPIPDVGPGWSAVAVVREWPDQDPPVHQWRTQDGSAVVESDELVLLMDRSSSWTWRSGELTASLTAPDGSRDVTDPIRVRLR